MVGVWMMVWTTVWTTVWTMHNITLATIFVFKIAFLRLLTVILPQLLE